MSLLDDLIKDWRNPQSPDAQPILMTGAAWLRLLTMIAGVYLICFGAGILLWRNKEDSWFGPWWFTVVVLMWGPVAALLVEFWLQRDWRLGKGDRLVRTMLEADALSLNHEPDLARQLISAHLTLFHRWCNQAQRWARCLGLSALLIALIGILLMRDGLLRPPTAASTWLAALGGGCLVLSLALFLLGASSLARTGRYVRQLAVARNAELVEPLHPLPPPTGTVRINAGGALFQDFAGRVWSADDGFIGGSPVYRGSLSISGTQLPTLYQSEHYGMTAFEWPVSNGTYAVILHFAETDQNVTVAGARKFKMKVSGNNEEEVDVFAAAQSRLTPLVKAYRVPVADGRIRIDFTRITMDPIINAIEILPSS